MNTALLDTAIEGLAAAVVMADTSDQESVDTVRRCFEKINEALPGSGASQELVTLANECIALEKRLGLFGAEADSEALVALSEAVGRLQALATAAAKRAAQAAAAQSKGQASPPAAAAAEPAPSAASASGTTRQRVTRDEETVDLIGEFLSESEEGLGRADQILMNVEHAEPNAEAVNGLFRVFHTVKGVAGFLDLPAITAVAHTTETMLNRCRDGSLKLAGKRLDVVFDATAMLRRMLGELRTAVQESVAFATAEDLEGLLQRLRVLTQDGTPADAAAAPVAVADAPAPAQKVDATPAAAPAAARNPEIVRTPVGAPVVQEAAEAESSEPPANPEAAAATPNAASPEAPGNNNLRKTMAMTAAPSANQGQDMLGGTKLRETVKVDLERVDSLVAMVGELVVVEAMVVNAPEIAKSASARVRNCLSQLAKVTRDLQDVSMRMRMLPVSGVFQKMARMSRDLGRKSGKQLRLVLSGEATEMDRSMVEHIADPLVHMIRNAVDHGLEPPAERRKAGKPEEGIIRLSAYHEGGSIVIELADDGRGLDRDAILAKARAQGLVRPNDTLTEADIHMLIFAPGFSTAKQITEVSGRGVGMDVVKRNMDALRGRVSISTTPGEGTTFKMLLPLTLAIIDGMLVACGRDRYIIPTLSIVESIQPSKGMLVTFADQHEMINVRGQILPLVRLSRLFGSSNAKTEPTEALVVIIEGVGRRLGLMVDEVVTQQQVVIKNLGQGLGSTRFLSGAAILADGRVGLIINVEEIAGTTVQRQWSEATAAVA
jgi:two-component system chemotaxis sensor kinase CheA